MKQYHIIEYKMSLLDQQKLTLIYQYAQYIK